MNRARRGVLSAVLLCLLALQLGCGVARSPLTRHANALASATIIVTHGAANAYTEANRLHSNAQMALAVLDYDRKDSWNPKDYVKPLLSPDQLQARIDILYGLKSYSETIATLSSGGKQAELDASATDLGASFQALSKNVSTTLSTSIPAAAPMSDTTRNGLSTALVALGTFLQQRQVSKSLPKVIEDNNKYVADLCQYLESDIVLLRRAADVDYGRLTDAEDQYIRHAGTTLSPAEHRAEVQKLPQLVLQQQQNDELLAKLDRTIRTLALTHHAFAAAAQGNNPESLSHYITDLVAEGQSLASFYESIATAPKAQ